MPDISVNCSHCGQVFSAPGDKAGGSTACPQCGKQVLVTASGARPEGAPKLQMKQDSTVTGSKRCLSCGAAMATDAVICIHCGFDARTGSPYIANPQKPRMLQWVLWGVGLIILAGLAKSVLLKGEPEAVPLAAAPVSQEPVVASQAAATAVATGETAAAVEPVAGVQTAAPSAVAASAPKRSPEEMKKIEADYRAALNRQLATSYPVYTPGNAVVLRRINGQVHRGTLAGLKPDAVVVVSGGQTNEIPMKLLDRASRLKCDPAFRAQVVDFHVQKRVKEVADF
mgnify:CR=1 FL=1